MNKNVIIDFEKNAITLTKTFARKAKIYGTPEYNILEELLVKYPNYTRKIKSSANRENYNGLTIPFMRKCVVREYASKDVENFDKIVELYEGHTAKASKVKSYFLKAYPKCKALVTTKSDEMTDEKEITTEISTNENTDEYEIPDIDMDEINEIAAQIDITDTEEAA